MQQDLIVVGFNGTRRATEVLTQLQSRRDLWAIDLADAVAAFRTDDGSLRIDPTIRSVSDEFVSNVGGMIRPGESAIFALIRTVSPELAAERFRGYGGRIIGATLSPVQAERIQRTLQG